LQNETINDFIVELLILYSSWQKHLPVEKILFFILFLIDREMVLRPGRMGIGMAVSLFTIVLNNCNTIIVLMFLQ